MPAVAALLLDTVARFQEQPEARLGRPSVTSLVDGELEAAVKAIQVGAMRVVLCHPRGDFGTAAASVNCMSGSGASDR